jgi:hypothetical protein
MTSILESTISESLLNIIEGHYGKSDEATSIVKTIELHAIKIFESVRPILKEDGDIVIILRCSRSH